MWLFATGKKSGKTIRIFHYNQTRSKEVPKKYLEGFKGTLQTDAYQGYNQLGLNHIACWAHLRRYFTDALPRGETEKDTRAKHAIKEINKLFKIEEKWYELKDEELLQLRQEKELPIVEAFFAWVKENIQKTTLNSKLGKAYTYAKNHEEKLKNYLNEPQTSLSNNLAENAIRSFVVGRKNWLFCGSPNGAEASAGIYSLIETAKANGLKPRKYLNYLLTEITKEGYNPSEELIQKLLPWQPEAQENCK